MQFINVAIKTFKFSEEVCVGEIAVNNADRIIGVERGHQVVAGGLDGLHVARSDVAGCTDEGKVFHVLLH